MHTIIGRDCARWVTPDKQLPYLTELGTATSTSRWPLWMTSRRRWRRRPRFATHQFLPWSTVPMDSSTIALVIAILVQCDGKNINVMNFFNNISLRAHNLTISMKDVDLHNGVLSFDDMKVEADGVRYNFEKRSGDFWNPFYILILCFFLTTDNTYIRPRFQTLWFAPIFHMFFIHLSTFFVSGHVVAQSGKALMRALNPVFLVPIIRLGQSSPPFLGTGTKLA